MTPTAALAKVKLRLDIETSDTSFDAFLTDALASAVSRLYPLVQRPVSTQSTEIATVSGLAQIDISGLLTPLTAVKKIEAYSSTSSYTLDDFYLHGDFLYIRNAPESISSVTLYGLTTYNTLDQLPIYLTQAIIWYAMSEFYDMLAAEKGRYNEYMNSGARNVDNMRDQSDYYEQKANVYLVDRVTIHGIG